MRTRKAERAEYSSALSCLRRIESLTSDRMHRWNLDRYLQEAGMSQRERSVRNIHEAISRRQYPGGNIQKRVFIVQREELKRSKMTKTTPRGFATIESAWHEVITTGGMK